MAERIKLIGDNNSYEVPEAVVRRMGEYYDAMRLMYEKLQDFKDKKHAASQNPCKDTRLAAWQAEKELLKLIP